MGIERSDVRRVAELAGLEPEARDMERLERELKGILAHMELLADVPLREADTPPTETAAPLRTDAPGADPLARPVRELAPDWRDGFFTVPRLPALGDAAVPGARNGVGQDGGEEKR